MADRSFLSWPFFESRHRELAEALDAWCAAHLHVDHADTDEACRTLVRDLGQAGWLRHSGAGEGETLDVRSLCLIRETLARHDGLADFAFAMQGLGMGASPCSARRSSASGWSVPVPAPRSAPLP